MDDATLLGFYKKLRDPHNDPKSRLFNFDPPAFHEYELILLDLVFQLPREKFSWSQRLRLHLKKYDEEIKSGLLPDLGLYVEDGPKDWHNAVRNMGRDYKRVTKKLF